MGWLFCPVNTNVMIVALNEATVRNGIRTCDPQQAAERSKGTGWYPVALTSSRSCECECRWPLFVEVYLQRPSRSSHNDQGLLSRRHWNGSIQVDQSHRLFGRCLALCKRTSSPDQTGCSPVLWRSAHQENVDQDRHDTRSAWQLAAAHPEQACACPKISRRHSRHPQAAWVDLCSSERCLKFLRSSREAFILTPTATCYRRGEISPSRDSIEILLSFTRLITRV